MFYSMFSPLKTWLHEAKFSKIFSPEIFCPNYALFCHLEFAKSPQLLTPNSKLLTPNS